MQVQLPSRATAVTSVKVRIFRLRFSLDFPAFLRGPSTCLGQFAAWLTHERLPPLTSNKSSLTRVFATVNVLSRSASGAPNGGTGEHRHDTDSQPIAHSSGSKASKVVSVLHRSGRRARMPRNALTIAVLLAGALLSPVQVVPAYAANCPANSAYDFVSNDWNPSNNDVEGIRAPIVLVTDAVTCSNSLGEGFAAAYIAIENNAITKITQIGFSGDYDPSLGGTKYCRFWAIDSGVPNNYGTCSLTNNLQAFFKIHTWTLSGGSTVYRVEDCFGDSTYTSCTVENQSEAKYTSSWAFVAEETNYGQSACTVHILGSSSNHLNIGTGTSGIEGQVTQQGSWGTESLTYDPPVCSHYQGNPSNTRIGIWDDRN